MERFVFYPDNCCITCNDLYNHSQPNGQKPTTTERGKRMITQQQKAEFLKAHPEIGELANGKLYRVANGTAESTEVRTVLDSEIRRWKDADYYTD
tara:strand:+ start:241 stop:525 length:285 start_codon:yes stop_codon:yes gene_type:complete